MKSTTLSAITYTTDISQDDASQVSDITNMPNSGLESKTPDQIYENAQKLGCVVAKIGEQIVGYVGLMPYEIDGKTIYERGSLRVDPEHRRKRISSTLVTQLVSSHASKALICLTKEPPVHHICTSKLNRNEYTGIDIQPTKLGEALEAGGDLIDKYSIYMSKSAEDIYVTLL